MALLAGHGAMSVIPVAASTIQRASSARRDPAIERI
jgi:hypothetical protein